MHWRRHTFLVLGVMFAAGTAMLSVGCSGGDDGAGSDAAGSGQEAEAPGKPPRYALTDTPEGKTFELRAVDPDTLREAMELMRSDPELAAVADQIDEALLNFEANEEGGTDYETSWGATKEEIKSSLPALLLAIGVDAERTTIDLK